MLTVISVSVFVAAALFAIVYLIWAILFDPMSTAALFAYLVIFAALFLLAINGLIIVVKWATHNV